MKVSTYAGTGHAERAETYARGVDVGEIGRIALVDVVNVALPQKIKCSFSLLSRVLSSRM